MDKAQAGLEEVANLLLDALEVQTNNAGNDANDQFCL
jgi:hypothetical protein